MSPAGGRRRRTVLPLLVAGALAAPAVPALAQGRQDVQLAPIQVQASPPAAGGGPDAMQKVSGGLLECRGAAAIAYGFGSTRPVRCEFRPAMGTNHYYEGTLERVGLDIGVSDQGSMLWMVLATSPEVAAGALAGTYVGVTSGFALGPGFSANMLASRDAGRSVTLQPLSISADSGLSLSFAGATLTLRPSAPTPQ